MNLKPLAYEIELKNEKNIIKEYNKNKNKSIK